MAPNGARFWPSLMTWTVRSPRSRDAPRLSVACTDRTWIPSTNAVESMFAWNPELSELGTPGKAACTSGREMP